MFRMEVLSRWYTSRSTLRQHLERRRLGDKLNEVELRWAERIILASNKPSQKRSQFVRRDIVEPKCDWPRLVEFGCRLFEENFPDVEVICDRYELLKEEWRHLHAAVGNGPLLEILQNFEIFQLASNNGSMAKSVQIFGLSFAQRSFRRKVVGSSGRRKRRQKEKIVEAVATPAPTAANPSGRRHRLKRQRNAAKQRQQLVYWGTLRKFDAKDLTIPVKKLMGPTNDRREILTPKGKDLSPVQLLSQMFRGPLVTRHFVRSSGLSAVLLDIIRRRKRVYLKMLLEECDDWKRQYDGVSPLDHYCFDVEVVIGFVQSALRRLVPSTLLGNGNLRRVLNCLATLLKLRKFDSISVKEVESQLRLKYCPWLKRLSDSTAQRNLFRSALTWVIQLGLRLVRSFFHPTDHQMGGQQLVYFRKSVWHQILRKHQSTVIESLKLDPIESGQVASRLKESYGPFELRFIPKSSGIRPIITCIHKPKSPADDLFEEEWRSAVYKMNRHLQSALAILRAVGLLQKSEYGSTDVNDFRSIWSNWQRYTSKTFSVNSQRKRFLVKADLINCFTSILQSKLLSCLEQVGKELDMKRRGHFIVQKFVHMRLRRGKLWRSSKTVAWLAKTGHVGLANFISHSGVAVPRGPQYWMSWTEAVEHLQPIISMHILRVKGHFFRQTAGISQGSAVSTALCDLYYRQLEREFFNVGRSDILMRYVDDYILVSNSLGNAVSFARTILTGIADYNLQAKPEKTVINFSDPELKQWQLKPMADRHVRWCGVDLRLNAEQHRTTEDSERRGAESV